MRDKSLHTWSPLAAKAPPARRATHVGRETRTGKLKPSSDNAGRFAAQLLGPLERTAVWGAPTPRNKPDATHYHVGLCDVGATGFEPATF